MNNKLTTKNWQRLRLNLTTKSITFTNDKTYKNESECLVDIKSNQYIAINKRRFDKMISEGWKVVDGVTKSTQNITESIQMVDLTGDPEIEESVRQYYVSRKLRKGVEFVKGASQKEIIPMWEQSTIDHSTYQRKLESDKKDSMKASFNVENEKYYKKRERELGNGNDGLLMDVYEVMNEVGIVQ